MNATESKSQAAVNDKANSQVIEKLEASQTECEILRRRVLELRKNLEEQQDFVFSLQPQQAKITETEAKSEFTSLCGVIEEWVDTNLGDAIQDKAMVEEKVALEPAKALLSLIPPSGREAFKYFDTDEHNIAAAIMQFLCENIFEREFYCPITPGAIDFLVGIERSMRNSNPTRSKSALHTEPHFKR